MANNSGRRARIISDRDRPFWGGLDPVWPVRFHPLPPYLSSLPGASQRLRALRVLAGAGLVVLLRPWWPLNWLPGWLVGLLLLWALGELVRWIWWPRRWR
ncbi:MAG: hypothetical protein VKI39_03545 [Synechococcus sp.]|nr:hypothetical protein [Synechococcus sp.]